MSCDARLAFEREMMERS